VPYEGHELHNIVDIYALRKRLIKLKDIDRVDFRTIVGSYFAEYNFGTNGDLVFASNFENGNLRSVIKVDSVDAGTEQDVLPGDGA